MPGAAAPGHLMVWNVKIQVPETFEHNALLRLACFGSADIKSPLHPAERISLKGKFIRIAAGIGFIRQRGRSLG